MRLIREHIPWIGLIISIALFMIVCLKSCVTENDITIETEPVLYNIESRKDRIDILKAMFAKSYNKKYLSDIANVENKVLQVKILEQIRYELRQYH